ncbi:regulator of (H+)-ATPase in vacuolar membrane [Dinochytrium kinnereticum]|nr:regulator of (H+)-ATPase in vacuolar membrane [Dinochytrium kinnereticum]
MASWRLILNYAISANFFKESYFLVTDSERKIVVYQCNGKDVERVSDVIVFDGSVLYSLHAVKADTFEGFLVLGLTSLGAACAWKFDTLSKSLTLLDTSPLLTDGSKSWAMGSLSREFSRLDSRLDNSLEYGHQEVFLTHSSDMELRFWLCSLADIDIRGPVWTCVFSMPLWKAPCLVKWGPYGKLAMCHNDSSSGCEVVIYSSNALGKEPLQELLLPLSSKILAIEFSKNLDGYVMLAIATESSVLVCRQRNTKLVQANSSWDKITEIDSIGPVASLTWILDDTLVIGSSSRLITIKCVTEPSRLDKDASSSMQNPIVSHEIEASTNHNFKSAYRRLPDYHPILLSNCLLYGSYTRLESFLMQTGQHDAVKGILLYLLRYIEQAQDVREEIAEIPSMFWKLLGHEGDSSSETPGQTKNYDALFTLDDYESQYVILFNVSDAILRGLYGFNEEKASRLHALLSSDLLLPGISGDDQQQLIAIVKAFVKIDQAKRSLDENGTRFVVASQLFQFSENLEQKSKGLALLSKDIAWAYFSESEDILLDFCNKECDNKMLWKDAQSMGIGLWLKSPETLKRTIELIARNLYMSKEDKDPVDCALFYILLRKKNVLLGLWKLASAHTEQGAMLKFLANDFTEERWQKAAAKNAFALLGKQRYEYAAAFFLLADKLKDAVNVCLKQLNDIQLAIVLCRVYDGENSPILDDIIRNVLIVDALKKNDRWTVCMSRSILKDYDGALDALVAKADSTSSDVFDPTLYILYKSLKKNFKSKRFKVKDVSPEVEADLFYNCAIAYDLMGCPSLALKTLAQVKPVSRDQDVTSPTVTVSPQKDAETIHMLRAVESGEIDWGAPVSKVPESREIDWGSPVSNVPAHQEVDWGAPVSKLSEPQEIDWGAPVASSQRSAVDDEYEAFKKSLLGPGEEEKAEEFDWGDPVGKGKELSLDDEFEAFKKSLMPESGSSGALKDELEDLIIEEGKEAKASQEKSGDTIAVICSRDELKVYKWSLGLKVAGLILSSIESVSVQDRVFKNDGLLNEFSESIKDGVNTLENLIEMPPNLIGLILKRYPYHLALCKISSNLIAYLHLNPLFNYTTFLEDLIEILLRMTDNLCLIAFDVSTPLKGYRYVSLLSRQLLFGVMRYHELAGSAVPNEIWPSVAKATAAAVIALSCSAVHLSDYRTLWWIAGLSDKLFTLLAGGGKKTELWPLLSDLLMTKEPMVTFAQSASMLNFVKAHPESGSDNSSDDEFSDEVKDRKQKFAKLILDTILLQHLAFDFEIFVTHTKESTPSTSQENLAERALHGISKLIYSFQYEMIPVSSNLKPSSSLVHRNLSSEDQRLLWSLLRRTTNLGKMIDFATGLVPKEAPQVDSPASSPEKEEPEHSEVEVSPKRKTGKKVSPRQSNFEIVYNADNIIGGFAINPLDPDSIAVATHDLVIEIDVASSLSYYKRRESYAERRESVDDLMVKQSPLDFDRESRVQNSATKVPRNLSYDSLERALKRSMTSLRKQDLAGHLESSGEATVKLFQFGQQRELVSYTTGSTARITRCRFDPFGIRFGATDAKGELHIWRFDSREQALRPAVGLSCNSNITNDFTFINCSTLLATAGVSTSGNNISLWDTLLPISKSRIKTFSGVESGAYSIVFSPRHNILLSGTKRGDIMVFDIRQQILRKSFHAHGNTVRTLAIDAENDCLISGSAGGDVKIWDLTQFEETETYDKMHTGPASKGYNELFGQAGKGYNELFSGMTSYGVMQISFHSGQIFTCGADGALRKSVKMVAPL